MNNSGDYYFSRQHLNLSRSALETVESDKLLFMARPSLSGMLNMIFSACCLDSDAAIEPTVERYRGDMADKLSELPDTEEKRRILDTLAENERRRLVEKVTSYGKDCPFKFQLDRDNYAFIQSWRDENGCYRNSPGAFIKAVIEEYAAMPFYDREAAILKERISLLKGAIESSDLITVTTGTANISERFEVRPYCICPDSEKSFHYLVGLTRPAMSKAEEIPASFRLSRIQKLSRSSSRSGRITSSQQKMIEERMKSVGVQFMLQSPETVTVRLTDAGMQMYERQLRMRPQCIKKEACADGTLCEFLCTPIQADYYFFKFGAEAEIVSPDKLRETFRRRYGEAFDTYNKEVTV